MKKKISILGSTGSIGTQTLDVVRKNGDIEVVALAAGSNIELLAKQIREFEPKLVCIGKPELESQLKLLVNDMDVKIVSGNQGLIEAAIIPEAEIVVTAVVGMMGIVPTIDNYAPTALATAKTNIGLETTVSFSLTI